MWNSGEVQNYLEPFSNPLPRAQCLSVHEGAYHASWYLILPHVDHRTLTLLIRTTILSRSLEGDSFLGLVY